jgi:Lrp/AsnC family leucine-responsive transcriptional regulator
MDNLDHQILQLLAHNARMTVKDIAAQVSLTSPAVSERIHRMEKNGIIAGYTVVLREDESSDIVDALINISLEPTKRQAFLEMVQQQKAVTQCFHVTGEYSYMLKVRCNGIRELEHLIHCFQALGQTSSQIILATLLDRRAVL